jgi:Epoxide hydrolase N terminus
MSIATDATTARPFHLEISDEHLDDLRRRIVATRWPSSELVDDRSQGVQLATLQELARYWTTEYDWRPCEARLNALPQFITEIDGVDIHFIHVRSPQEDALPLIMTNGWPGSVIELLETLVRGWKDSLFGDHHIHGSEGVRFNTRGKAIAGRWPGEAPFTEHHSGNAVPHCSVTFASSITGTSECPEVARSTWLLGTAATTPLTRKAAGGARDLLLASEMNPLSALLDCPLEGPRRSDGSEDRLPHSSPSLHVSAMAMAHATVG